LLKELEEEEKEEIILNDIDDYSEDSESDNGGFSQTAENIQVLSHLHKQGKRPIDVAKYTEEKRTIKRVRRAERGCPFKKKKR
jgi:hypothetical protein